jgi:hypothetical protein
MTGRRFLYIFPNPGRPDYPHFQIAHDEPLRPHQEKERGPVLYKTELTGVWAGADLMEIIKEFRRLRDKGALPPTNMLPPPKPDAGPAMTREEKAAERQAEIAARRAKQKLYASSNRASDDGALGTAAEINARIPKGDDR